MNHVDLIANDGIAGYQYLIGRAESYAPSADFMLQHIADQYGDGSYVVATAPHGDDECPFREYRILAMRTTEVKP